MNFRFLIILVLSFHIDLSATSCVAHNRLIVCRETLMLAELARFQEAEVISLIGVRETCVSLTTMKAVLPHLKTVEVANNRDLCTCLLQGVEPCGVDLAGCGPFKIMKCPNVKEGSTAPWIGLGVLGAALICALVVGAIYIRKQKKDHTKLQETVQSFQLSRMNRSDDQEDATMNDPSTSNISFGPNVRTSTPKKAETAVKELEE